MAEVMEFLSEGARGVLDVDWRAWWTWVRQIEPFHAWGMIRSSRLLVKMCQKDTGGGKRG